VIIKEALDWDDFDQPLFGLSQEDDNVDNFWNDNNLTNPYSKATCLILYLYSMELGSVPLFAAVNRAIRSRDASSVHSLGPYAFALAIVTDMAEQNRIEGDKYLTGAESGEDEALGIFGESFVVYRGGRMKTEWIR